MNKQHWMRRPRWFTKDKNYAESSIFQWELCQDSVRCNEKFGDPIEYRLSILGAINGPLALTGYVLTAYVNTDTQEIESLAIRKKWW